MEELKSLRTDERLGVNTSNRTECERESNLIGNEFLSEILRYLEHIKARRGLSLHGPKYPGVHHLPKN